ncbi:hypothetical protein EYF80_001596 [Liparis tanakae]|uniref:Uncharacterized protein n=1 Tax=Liparis tanakae TaxID=230148 RepID=A0A4Z2JCI3_9TELE|nr:hypothetical protein EYF80_001596 [Liparis tanakae]
MLISSRGQLGLNVAHLEEGQRQRLLPGREHEAPAVHHSWRWVDNGEGQGGANRDFKRVGERERERKCGSGQH